MILLKNSEFNQNLEVCYQLAADQQGQLFKNPIQQRLWARTILNSHQLIVRRNWPKILPRTNSGAPLVPYDNLFWSVSHKPGAVAAAAAPDPVGIDVEFITPRRPELINHVLNSNEQQQLFSLKTKSRWERFFQAWTAKEAVLKAIGIGLAGLSSCRVISAPDYYQTIIKFEETLWLVNHHACKNYLFAVTCDNNFKKKLKVNWRNLTSAAEF